MTGVHIWRSETKNVVSGSRIGSEFPLQVTQLSGTGLSGRHVCRGNQWTTSDRNKTCFDTKVDFDGKDADKSNNKSRWSRGKP